LSGSTARAAVEAYGSKTVAFKFRSLEFEFVLSRGLFSSAGIDTGSRLLLKALSQKLDKDAREGRRLPASVLDAGCGVGVLGICAAKALAAVPGLVVRGQDRDELARSFTEYNARRNGLGSALFSAHTGALLDGPGDPWDLILSNLPAKTGKPVLLDFISRSAGLLAKDGAAMVVAVNTLAPLLRGRIGELRLPLLGEETGKEHTVLAYGAGAEPGAPAARENAEGDPPGLRPAYFRGGGNHELEDTVYHIDAVHGAPGFDRSGAAVEAMARLAVRLGRPLADHCVPGPILVHEPDQGHFPAWFRRHLEKTTGNAPGRLVLSGRNILALEAARHNTGNTAAAIPAADLSFALRALLEAAGGPCAAAFLFPGLIPGTGRVKACWDSLGSLLASGGFALAALPSSGAERFDRAKPRGFLRLGDYKRRGFRALGYQKQ
jgi:hypothetical protein